MRTAMRRLALLLCAFVFGATHQAGAQKAARAAAGPSTPAGAPGNPPTQGEWGDQGDGTFANPVMPGDFSDLDAIRVGDRFYAITSTFQYSPGMAVLESRDLVNWSFAGHVVEDVTTISPAMGWQTMDRAGRGIWAGSIRFHRGRFWVYFGTPDEGLFMSSAKEAAGPWTPLVPVLPTGGWDDPCPFWDDDGQGYLVTTHYAKEADGTNYNIHLFKLTPDGTGLVAGFDRTIHRSRGSEANKLYKIRGLYYHYYSEVRPEGRVAMIERAKSLDGPWESRQLIHVNKRVDKEPNQGGLIELTNGKWYFLTHQGTGDWEGRAGVLLPVTWVDGWPVLGRVGADGIGTMVWRSKKPIEGMPKTQLVASDDFGGKTLRPEWEWNYQPRAAMWSLTERPGFLRLHAFAALRSGDFSSVGDVLTQRAMRTRRNQVTVKLDLAGMVDGQEAGLAHYAKTEARLAVTQRAGVRHLEYVAGDAMVAGPAVAGTTIWLRSDWGFDGLSRFSYSLDGKAFVALGEIYALTWGHYRGDRIGLYTFGSAEHGFVDVDSFLYEIAR